MLNQALINYGLSFLRQKQYDLLQTPFFMKKNIMAKTAQLEEFDEALYKVVSGAAEEDMYLIATSEQPISALHMNEWLVEEQLPFR
jgi:seryl-tRNA synthetase